MRTTSILLAILIVFLCSKSSAHKPIVIEGGVSSPEQPYYIEDIDISQVAYHKATHGNLEIWLKFSGKEGQELKIDIGSPKLDSSKPVYYPAVAVLSKKFPPVTVPFNLPVGYGGKIYDTRGQIPKVFYEQFTGTRSWRFEPFELVLPETGDYYIVGYLPEPREGKFWIAVGEREKFTFWDFIKMPEIIVKVRSFHEVFPVGGLLFWVWIIIVLALVGLLVGTVYFFL
ncbi:MAG: hypothetical protein N3G21_10025 [Candidatus Hydrogenedentes bacterium]|nr:hypothetical protein [Candidatus Hydrogenedentota bacterium]